MTEFTVRECCPACGAREERELYSVEMTEPPISDYLTRFYSEQGSIELECLKGMRFILDECLECGLIYQRWILGDLLMRKLYEEWIDPTKALALKVRDFHIDMVESKLTAMNPTQVKQVEASLTYLKCDPSELLALDFGMGWGTWCVIARAYGINVVGVEISMARIEYARSTKITVIDWESIPNHRFDLIRAYQVLEHVGDPFSTVKYLSQSLKLGGLMVIGVPEAGDIRKRLKTMDWGAGKYSKNSLNAVAPLEHINCFAGASLEKMVKAIGLVPVDISCEWSKFFTKEGDK